MVQSLYRPPETNITPYASDMSVKRKAERLYEKRVGAEVAGTMGWVLVVVVISYKRVLHFYKDSSEETVLCDIKGCEWESHTDKMVYIFSSLLHGSWGYGPCPSCPHLPS